MVCVNQICILHGQHLVSVQILRSFTFGTQLISSSSFLSHGPIKIKKRWDLGQQQWQSWPWPCQLPPKIHYLGSYTEGFQWWILFKWTWFYFSILVLTFLIKWIRDVPFITKNVDVLEDDFGIYSSNNTWHSGSALTIRTRGCQYKKKEKEKHPVDTGS